MSERKKQPVISLCIPTNGVIEWVFPVLESIFSQDAEKDEYEVIVTDNGHNGEFAARMEEYIRSGHPVIYRQNDSYMFHNQLEALKEAGGEYLKFVNHRSPLEPGALKAMIALIRENREKKPPIFFSSGRLKGDTIRCGSFDEFVRNLGQYASWTTGVGIWKTEYERVRDHLTVDRISPHSCLLFSDRKAEEYLICNAVFCRELTEDHSKKGNYDVFKAFGVEELSITQKLYIDGDITADTLKSVKRDYRKMVTYCYTEFCLLRRPCSYDLSGFDDAMGIYFSKTRIVAAAVCQMILRILTAPVRGGKV